MAGRTPVLILLGVLVLAGLLASRTGSYLAAVPEGSIQFQDGAGNVRESFIPGDTVLFYVRDAALSPSTTSVATWSQVPAQVSAGSTWSLATGQPHQSVYSLSVGTAYDTSKPANTPLSAKPTAEVNGVTTLVATFDALTGEFTLLNNVDASSTLEVSFEFDAVDSFAAGERRAKVTSSSDPEGEWASISEVVSETDSSPSSTSGLFRGEVTLTGDGGAIGPGDGAVWVQGGDGVTAAYYQPGGTTVIASHNVPGAIATSTPSPTPTATPTVGPTSTATLTPSPTTSPVVKPSPTQETSQKTETSISKVPEHSVPGSQMLALVSTGLLFALAITWQLRRLSDAIRPGK